MNEQLPQFIHQFIHQVGDRLRAIEGIVAIALGGSRARGNHTPKSDVDLGLYYQPENPPNLLALNHLASELDDTYRTNLITPIGEWGKWINGGGCLRVEGIPVDFLYRDMAQVNQVINDCHDGKIAIDYQPGHPHGFGSSIYMGEVALGLLLHDPNSVLAALKAKTRRQDIEVSWAGCGMEKLFDPADLLKIQKSVFSDSDKFDKKKINMAIQENLIKKSSVSVSVSKATTDTFKKLLRFLSESLSNIKN